MKTVSTLPPLPLMQRFRHRATVLYTMEITIVCGTTRHPDATRQAVLIGCLKPSILRRLLTRLFNGRRRRREVETHPTCPDT